MPQTRPLRGGLTLTELLVSVGIVACLLGLLVPAVIKVRGAATRTQGINQLRQITLATQSAIEQNGDKIKGSGMPILLQILPYIEQGAVFEKWREQFHWSVTSWQASTNFPVRIYISPSDPSDIPEIMGVSSYAANQVLFSEGNVLGRLLDGTSNTIAFAEHYAWNCDGAAYFFVHTYSHSHPVAPQPGMPNGGTYRGAYFASAAVGDVHPIRNASETVASSTPPKTFQVRPPTGEGCDPTIPQTPHASGMLTAMADGSVRAVSPGVSGRTFWAAVTPKGGEALGDW